MNKRRQFIRSLLIATAMLSLPCLLTDGCTVLRLGSYAKAFRGPAAAGWVPKLPFVFAAGKIILFYVLLGVVLGTIVWGMSRVLASVRHAGGRWSVPERRYWTAFLSILLAATVYLHVHALLTYPALFNSSWRWAALAGAPGVGPAVGLIGNVALLVLVVAVVHKRRWEILGWIRRHGRTMTTAVAVFAVATGAMIMKRSAARSPNLNRGPNVIFLGIDSVRPDHVSAFGYPRNTTPNLDRFLRDSVAFTNAFVPLARTGPSWISVLTGCDPPTHGQRDDLPPKETRIPPVPTLASHLQNLGYRTSFFLDNSTFMCMEPELGFARISQPRPDIVTLGLSFLPLHLSLYYYVLNDSLGFYYAPRLRANQAFSTVYDWRYFSSAIARALVLSRRDGKFFLAAHTCIGHAPFHVRYPYSTYFAPPPPAPLNRFAYRLPFELMLSGDDFLKRAEKYNWPPLLAQENNLYDTLVRETDDWLGSVLDAIRRQGLYDNSLIVVFADHGEDLYRPDLAYPGVIPLPYLASNHGFHVWGDDGYRIVLAIKLPKSESAGRQVPWLVRSIDIAPTVLDALGLPPLMEAQGISLMPQIANPARDPHLSAYGEAGWTLPFWFIPGHRPYPYSHWALFHYIDPQSLRIYRKQEYMAGFVMAKDRTLRDDRWKIIAYPMEGNPLGFRTTLHDVERDPTNRLDLATSEPIVLAEMRARLAPFIETDAQTYRFQWRWLETARPQFEVTNPPPAQKP